MGEQLVDGDIGGKVWQRHAGAVAQQGIGRSLPWSKSWLMATLVKILQPDAIWKRVSTRLGIALRTQGVAARALEEDRVRLAERDYAGERFRCTLAGECVFEFSQR